MSDVLDELRAQLHDLGADAPEADAVLHDLVGLRELADAPPAPSAELAALLGRAPAVAPVAGTAATPGPPRRTRSSGAWARRGGTVGGAVVVLVSSLGATGLSAAANTLPEPLQERVAGFSRAYLPFEFPSVADRREHDPFGAGRHRAEHPRADRQQSSSAPAPLVPVRPTAGSEASRQQVPASRSAARPEPTRAQSVSAAAVDGAAGTSGRPQGEGPRGGGPGHAEGSTKGHGNGHAKGHAKGHDKPRSHPAKPRSADPAADPAAAPVPAPVVLPVKAPAAAPVEDPPVLPPRPRHPQRPTLGPPPVEDAPDETGPDETGPDQPAVEEPGWKPHVHAWDDPVPDVEPAVEPAVEPGVDAEPVPAVGTDADPRPAVADEAPGG